MSVEKMEIAEIDLDWVAPFTNWNIWEKLVYSALLLASFSYGVILFSGLICFEMNGGDPQKRGLANQLISQACLQGVMFFATSTPVVLWKCMIGWNYDNVFWIYWSIMNSFAFQVIFSLTFIIGHRYWTVVVHKRMLNVQDNFLAKFLGSLSLILGSWHSLIMCQCNLSSFLVHRFRGQYLPGHSFSIMKFNPLLVMLAVCSIPLAYVAIAIEREKSRINPEVHGSSPEAEAQGPHHRLNNWVHNQDVVKTAVVVTFFFGILVAGFIVTMSMKQDGYLERFKNDLMPPILIMVVMPTILYQRNPDLRNYVRQFCCFH